MAINQSLIRDMRAYRAPYGSNRRSPSYTDPQTGAAKAPAPAATGALESRSVVRGPGIANDEMDESDDAEMVTQTQTPLTANARGPRYTEGSVMDLFTGHRTGTKNANYNADQPITDTNTPYLATKGFWGGLDRVLGNKSNELNEAAQQQQGAKWDTANKLKSSQDREDTVTNNANTFIKDRDAAGVAANKDTASALATAQAKAATAKVTADTETARVAQANAVLNATTQDGFNKASALLLASAKNQEQKDQIAAQIAAAAAQNGFNVEAATEAFKRAEKLQENQLNKPTVNSDGTITINGKVYIKDPDDDSRFNLVKLGNTGPGRASKNGQVGEAKTAAKPPASQASDAASGAPVTSSSKPAYLSSDDSFAGPLQDPNSDAAKTAAAQMAEYNASPSADDPNPLASIAEAYSGSLFPLVKKAGKIMSKVGPNGTGVIKKLASFMIDKAGEFNPKQKIQQQEEQQKLQDDEIIRRARNSQKPSFTE